VEVTRDKNRMSARLLRAYAMQLEAYRRVRHGGDQYVRVEHMHARRRSAG
jgi:hypothetical protein